MAMASASFPIAASSPSIRNKRAPSPAMPAVFRFPLSPSHVLNQQHQIQKHNMSHLVLNALIDSDKPTSETAKEDLDLPPPGCSRITVDLNRPLGIVLEEDKAGNIFVAEVAKNGNADKSGLVDVGDQLIATSAVIYGNEDYYQGVKVRKGMQIVRLNVRGEKFKTVMAAIGTHPAHMKVTVELQKCKPVPNNSAESNGGN